MEKTLTKIDAPQCKATVVVLRVIAENDNSDYWTASVRYFENGTRLFSESTRTVRLTQADALNDGIELAKQNNFA